MYLLPITWDIYSLMNHLRLSGRMILYTIMRSNRLNELLKIPGNGTLYGSSAS